MNNLEELHDNIKIAVELYSNGIKGSTHYCKVAQGQHHLKKKIKFSILKWTLHSLSIVGTFYIIYKAIA